MRADRSRAFAFPFALAFAFALAAHVACGQAAEDASPAAERPPTGGDRGDAAVSSASPSSTPATDAATVAPASDAGAPFLAVLSAFPAETAPIIAQTQVESTAVIGGHPFRIGTLRGVRVAVGLTGMGLKSATDTAHAVLAQLPVTGVVFSGVAGSKLRIGDVAVPTSWSLKATSATYAADATWVALATSLFSSGTLCLEHCTVVPATGVPVCMDHVPSAAVGGVGQSDETSVPVPCNSGGDDVFGCDVPAAAAGGAQCDPMGPSASAPDAGAEPLINDNETAAVAAEAAARGLPFIAFRGVSDGAGDPLGLPGYPAQFFAYYRLAARNAAAATMAFVARVGAAKP